MLKISFIILLFSTLKIFIYELNFFNSLFLNIDILKKIRKKSKDIETNFYFFARILVIF